MRSHHPWKVLDDDVEPRAEIDAVSSRVSSMLTVQRGSQPASDVGCDSFSGLPTLHNGCSRSFCLRMHHWLSVSSTNTWRWKTGSLRRCGSHQTVGRRCHFRKPTSKLQSTDPISQQFNRARKFNQLCPQLHQILWAMRLAHRLTHAPPCTAPSIQPLFHQMQAEKQ